MKIVVDKMPETPKDCMFSESIVVGTYACMLRPYIDKVKCKPSCLCKDVTKCDRLIEFGEVGYKR